MRTTKAMAILAGVLAGGLVLTAADHANRIQPQQMKPKPVKPIAPDPKRIAVSAPREFVIASPDMGTEAVFPVCAAAGGYQGYALVYEALTDRIGQGHVQVVFLMRDRQMNDLKGPVYNGPVPLTEKSENSQLRFVRLMRVPGDKEKFLCVYELDQGQRRQGYYRVIDPFTMGEFGEARPLGRPDDDVRVSSVRFLPGQASAVIVFNVQGKARYLVVDMNGRPVYVGRPGHSPEQDTMSEASDIEFLPDGQWLIAGNHRISGAGTAWGLRNMDPFGVWTSPVRSSPEMARAPLALVDVLRPNLLLVRNRDDQAALVDQEGKTVKIIPSPPYAGRPSLYVERLENDRLMFFYAHENGQRGCDIDAQIIDLKGNVLKPPQTILRDVNDAAAFARAWGSKSELVVFAPVPGGSQAKFRYVTIRE